jgi:hypothetical protein
MRLALEIYPCEGKLEMNFMVRELATINLFIIWLILIGAFAFLKIVKNHLQD